MKPYVWTLSYYESTGAIRRVFEIDAQASLNIDFYLPGKYLLRAHVPTPFYSGVIENTTIPTQDELTINVFEGSGYKKDSFVPGLMVVTPYSGYFLRTEIIEIQNFGDDRAGNAILSFDEVRGQKNGQVFATLSVEGLLDNLSVDGVYYDKTLLTLKAINAVPGSGWSIYSQGLESKFTATNSNLQSGKVVSFKFLFDTKNIAGISGITWGPAVISGSYKKETIALRGVDGTIRVE